MGPFLSHCFILKNSKQTWKVSAIYKIENQSDEITNNLMFIALIQECDSNRLGENYSKRSDRV